MWASRPLRPFVVNGSRALNAPPGISRHHNHHRHTIGLARRTFLCEAYRNPAAWNERLQTAILQRINPDTFYYELDAKFQQPDGKCSAIDLDLYANRLTDAQHTDELADLMHKLRLSAETTSTLPSTSHAVCRVFLDHGAVHDLMPLLDDRISYGVFLDAFAANLALDRLLRAKDYTAAARIATFQMLQEELDASDITQALSLYACFKHVQAPSGPFVRTAVAGADEAAALDPALAQADAKAAAPTAAGKKKKVEEVRVRVAFIRNAFFDGHFDLRDERQLVGKTLATIGRQLTAAAGAAAESVRHSIGNSAQLLGLWQLGELPEAVALVQRLSASGAPVHADVVQLVVADVAAVSEPSAEQTAFAEAINALRPTVTSEFERDVCAFANEAVQRCEANEIEAQSKVSSM